MKTTKRIMLTAIFAALTAVSAAAAAGETSVAALEMFSNADDADYCEQFTEGLRDALKEKKFNVLEARKMNSSLDDETADKLDEGKCKDLACLNKAAGAMGVDYLFVFEAKKEGSDLKVKIVLIDAVDEAAVASDDISLPLGSVSKSLEALTEKTVGMLQAKPKKLVWKPEKANVFEGELVEPPVVKKETPAETKKEDKKKKKEEPKKDSFLNMEPEKKATWITYAKWSSLGATGALGCAMIFTGVMAKKRQDDYNDFNKKYRDFDMTAKKDADNYALATNVLIGVTSVFAAAATTFFLLDYFDIGRDEKENKFSAAFSPLPGGAAASIDVRF